MVVQKLIQNRIEVLPNDDVEKIEINNGNECQVSCTDIDITVKQPELELPYRNCVDVPGETYEFREGVEFIPLNTIKCDENGRDCESTRVLCVGDEIKEKRKSKRLPRNSLYFQNQAFDATICLGSVDTIICSTEPTGVGSFVNHRYKNEDEELESPKTCRNAWPENNQTDITSKVIYDKWVSTSDLEPESNDNLKLNKIINKVKYNFQYVKNSLSNRRVQYVTNEDDWSITIPTSLSIEAKDSDWSSQINDIEKSNNMNDHWVSHIPSNDITVKTISEVNNNVCFECSDIPLQEFKCSESINNNDLIDELSLKQKYITSVESQHNDARNSDWLFNIKSIRSNNPRDEVWTTIINAILLS